MAVRFFIPFYLISITPLYPYSYSQPKFDGSDYQAPFPLLNSTRTLFTEQYQKFERTDSQTLHSILPLFIAYPYAGRVAGQRLAPYVRTLFTAIPYPLLHITPSPIHTRSTPRRRKHTPFTHNTSPYALQGRDPREEEPKYFTHNASHYAQRILTESTAHCPISTYNSFLYTQKTRALLYATPVLPLSRTASHPTSATLSASQNATTQATTQRASAPPADALRETKRKKLEINILRATSKTIRFASPNHTFRTAKRMV